MNCKGCNKEIDEESSFCKYCGKKIEIEDKLSDISKEVKEMTKQLRENFVIDSLFYEKNPAILKKFRKFAKEKLKLFEKLKKQGKYEAFIDECEERLYNKEDKNIKSKTSSKKKGKIK